MAATFNFEKTTQADGTFLDNRLNKGADWVIQFTFTNRDTLGVVTPLDLTNADDIRLHVRESFTSAIIVQATIANTFFVKTDATGGVATMTIPGSTTKDITVPASGQGIYDLEIQFSSGAIERKLEGTVEISDNVTQEP